MFEEDVNKMQFYVNLLLDNKIKVKNTLYFIYYNV